MQKVVQLSVIRNQRDHDLAAAWDRFAEAMERSKRSLKFEDGIAAGKLYREFMELAARKAS